MFFLPLFIVILAGCEKKPAEPPASRITISDVSRTEGTGGHTSFDFTVKLDRASAKGVTVQYKTMDGTATAANDFTAVAGNSLQFAANETEKTISIMVVGDDLREGTENFSVQLYSATNGVIDKITGTAEILNDDTRVPIPTSGYDAPTSYAGYTLAWADEFNGSSLDLSAWSHENGDGCPNVCGWGNNELEWYTDRPDNLFFQDGKLIIEAKKESFSGKQYTSSKILTRGKKVFTFGRIDIRARLPKGKGIWPAFWMLPQNNVFGGWPRSGEIDIMELVGHEPHKVYGTLHYGPGPGSTQISNGFTLGSGNFSDAFHVFSLEWKQDQIRWYVDGALFATVNKSQFGTVNYPFNESFFLIFNLAVGGNWPGSPDANTTFPQWLMVDYVRVYQ